MRSRGFGQGKVLDFTTPDLRPKKTAIPFGGAPAVAERLRLEKKVGSLRTTPENMLILDAMFAALGDIHVIGGKGGDLGQSRLDIWFNMEPFAAAMAHFGAATQKSLLHIGNSVVTDFTPGAEVTVAMGAPTMEERVQRIDSYLLTYRDYLLGFGAPTPANLFRRRAGVEEQP